MHLIKIKNQNILFISDTHGKHRNLEIPTNLNIIIHCGDICTDGNMAEITDFFEWYSQLNIPYKIFINGNHDLPFELEPLESRNSIPKNVIWLNNSSVTIHQIKIIGLNQSSYYQEIEEKNEIDILLSHYPPLNILDNGIGSLELRNYVIKTKPKYCVFGHNHEGYGKIEVDNITFLNASVFNEIHNIY